MLSRIVIALGVGDDDNRDQPFATSYRIKRNIRTLSNKFIKELARTFPSAFTSIGIISAPRWMMKSSSRRELSAV